MAIMKEMQKDLLKIKKYDTRAAMGAAAAADAERTIVSLLAQKDEINMIFAAAPSQNEVLQALVEDRDIPWDRINAFHMDEYIGLPQDAPQGFGNFLKTHIFGFIPFKQIHYIDITATDPVKEAERYANLLSQNPPDIVVMGIGENGHIAFNDPPADFSDTSAYKVVDLADSCIQQQIREGWFATPEDAYKQAISMTCAQIMKCRTIISVVPYAVKAQAIHDTLTLEETNMVPATLMKRHSDITVYCDADSAAMVPQATLDHYR